MGNPETHLGRVLIRSAGVTALVGFVAEALESNRLKSSQAFNDEIGRLKNMTREEAILEYKVILNELNSITETIEKLK